MKKLLFIIFFGACYFLANAQTIGIPPADWSTEGNGGLSATNFIGTTDAQPLIFRTKNTERMRLLSDGCFGIGTSTPQTLLHLHDSRITGGTLLPEDSTDTRGEYTILRITTTYSSTNGFSIHRNSNENSAAALFFKQHEQAPLYIEGPGGGLAIASNGNIGIGGGAIQAKLDVNGSFKASSATLSGALSASSATLTGVLNAQSAIVSGALSASSANISGNVGIGVTIPTVKLDVGGVVRAHELKVCLSQGCDYVFEDGYNLMSLNDLNKFIKTNKHLPDVAPAAVMEAEGINLSEMNALLLRKIEELTLYIIGQEEQLKELQKRLSEVESMKGGK